MYRNSIGVGALESRVVGAGTGVTPISPKEAIPWRCRRLVIGTGTGALPVMDEVKQEAKRRKIKLVILPTRKAIQELKQEPAATNAILHVTCKPPPKGRKARRTLSFL